MTTYTDFAPPVNQMFQFQPTLDGNQYIVTVPWNQYGKRYYINIQDLLGNTVLFVALIGSPPDYDINLISLRPDIFTTSTLVFRQATQQFEVNP